MKKQWRICGLGNYSDYYSYFLFGIAQGAFLNNAWFRSVPLFGRGLNKVFEEITWFKPDLVMCHMIFNRQPHNIDEVMSMLKKLRNHGIKIAYHAGDARPEPRFPSTISNVVDFALCNHNLMEKYSNIWKVPCYYWPYQCLNQNDIVDPVDMFKCNVAFAGSLEQNQHHAPRAAFIKKLKEKIKVKTFPTPESGNTRFQTAELSSSAKAVLGFQMGLEIPGYIDVRPFQYIGAGALYFHDRHKNVERFFRDGEHYVAFERDNADDFIKKYKYYVEENPELGQKIRTQGFRYCQKYHSSKERVASVISLLEGKGYYIYALNKNNEVEKVQNPWIK